MSAAVRRIAVIDDKIDSRQSLADELCGYFEVKMLQGPYHTPADLFREAKGCAESAVCDHHLSVGNYAGFTGAELMKTFYENEFPAVLVTNYANVEHLDITRYRRWVPKLLLSAEATPDAIAEGIEASRGEFAGIIPPSRRPFRSLIRIEEVDEDRLNIVATIAGWRSEERICLAMDMIENEEIRKHVRPGERFYARVNRGAEKATELYFSDFEYRGGGAQGVMP